MNSQKGRENFKNFRILLDSGFSSTISMIGLIKAITPKEDGGLKSHTQASSITTNLNFKIYFTLPDLSVTKIVTWNWYVDDSDKYRYYMILGRDILKSLVFNLGLYYHAIEKNYRPFKGSTTYTVDLVSYEFKYLNTGKIKPEEWFTYSYAK